MSGRASSSRTNGETGSRCIGNPQMQSPPAIGNPVLAQTGACQTRCLLGAERRLTSRAMTIPPLRAAIVPVTPLQQNCSLIWCTATMRGAFVDPGGDLPKLRAAALQHGVTVEKI